MYSPLKKLYADPNENFPMNKQNEDDDLAEFVSKSLNIGENEISKLDMTSYKLPTKTHSGLYCNTLLDCSMKKNEDRPRSPPPLGKKGVPGFPDFPTFWEGEEGGARTKDSSNENQQSWKEAIVQYQQKHKMSRCRHRRRTRNKHCSSTTRKIIRKSVNHQHISAGKLHKISLKEERRKKKLNTILKMAKKKQLRSDMSSLNKALSSLKC